MSAISKNQVDKTATNYTDMYDKGTAEDRKSNYTTLVNNYYDLATDFYEYGWGRSFHFAPRHKGEALAASLSRHEHFLALRLGLKTGMKVLDVGCGVGGPLMEIARFSGANITGLNNNAYQISRGQKYIQANGLGTQCDFMKADFMNMPVSDNTYDAVYAIEATCHAPSKLGIYSEIYRVLKPGAYFSAYEWLMTDKYDPDNEVHNAIKHAIELGDGLPSLDNIDTCLKALKDSGFEIIDARDLATPTAKNPVPWYEPLEASFTLSGFRMTPVGVTITHTLLTVLEKVGLAPKGSVKSHDFLREASVGLVKGGQQGIFTPMYYFLVRKPENASS